MKGTAGEDKLDGGNRARLQTIESSPVQLPVLRNPDFEKQFIIHTDAFETGLGVVLSQVFNREEHPVVYVSRKLSAAKQKYAAVDARL